MPNTNVTPLDDLASSASETRRYANVALEMGASPDEVLTTILTALGLSLDELPLPFRMMIGAHAAKAIDKVNASTIEP